MMRFGLLQPGDRAAGTKPCGRAVRGSGPATPVETSRAFRTGEPVSAAAEPPAHSAHQPRRHFSDRAIPGRCFPEPLQTYNRRVSDLPYAITVVHPANTKKWVSDRARGAPECLRDLNSVDALADTQD